MTEHQRDRRAKAWRDAAAGLAAELRAITEALAVRDLALEDLATATERARALRRGLEGPRRTRWYDAEEDAVALSPSSREAYLHQSPIRGEQNPIAPPLRVCNVTRPDGSRGVEAKGRLGMAYEGPPHGVHGGWVAALFDEVLGSTQGLADSPGVTALLKIRYRHITPLEEELRLAGWIHDQRSRRIVARATCHAGDTLTADAEGTFVRVDWNEIQASMRRRKAQRSGAVDPER